MQLFTQGLGGTLIEQVLQVAITPSEISIEKTLSCAVDTLAGKHLHSSFPLYKLKASSRLLWFRAIASYHLLAAYYFILFSKNSLYYGIKNDPLLKVGSWVLQKILTTNWMANIKLLGLEVQIYEFTYADNRLCRFLCMVTLFPDAHRKFLKCTYIWLINFLKKSSSLWPANENRGTKWKMGV